MNLSRNILHLGRYEAFSKNVSRSMFSPAKRGIVSSFTDIFKSEDISKYDKEHFNFPKEPKKKDVFDYIIVGGGSAGAALMWRLIQNDQNSVAVFDLGSYWRSIESRIPAALGFAMHSSFCSKHYYTVPQPELSNREFLWPRGIGIGGSSNINGMVHIRGHPEDFSDWEKAGAKGWSYDQCLPFFKMLETCEYGNAAHRGKHGPIKVTRKMDSYYSHLTDRFIKAGHEAGYKLSDDFNGSDREGFGYYDLAIDDGERASVSQAYAPIEYLLDFMMEDLSIFGRKKVEKVLIEGDKAVGVECNGKKYYAKKEVIVCSGALESPMILMKSGIGDEEMLSKNGIKTISHVPGVGKNLQDHLEVYIQARTNARTLYELEKSLSLKALSLWYWIMHGAGPLSSSFLDSGAFLKSDSTITNPDIQLHFFPYLVIDHGKNLPSYNAFQIHAGTGRPKSRGSISMVDGKMVIDPRYCSEKSDYDDLVKCVNIAMDVINQPSLKDIITEVISNTSDMSGFIKNNVDTAYHPSCTCKMGDIENDPTAVLDSSFKVKGVQNLRVIDASAMPSIISSNLNATVVMMAERGAKMILADNPVHVPSQFIKTPANL